MKMPIKTLSNGDGGEIDLDDSVFGLEARTDLIQRVILWQLAKRRSGTHKTKTMSEVRGSTKKPFKQKGTGRARQGSRRAPHMRGGGTAFGPVVRSHEFDLPKKVRKAALRHALSAKASSGQLVVLDEMKTDSRKTGELVRQLRALGIESALFIGGDDIDANFALAARNLPKVDVLPQQGANVYDILRSDVLVLAKDAVERLGERLR